jgi:hypothetical protein
MLCNHVTLFCFEEGKLTPNNITVIKTSTLLVAIGTGTEGAMEAGSSSSPPSPANSMALLFGDLNQERDSDSLEETENQHEVDVPGQFEEETEEIVMQTDQGRPNLGATFYQCRAAREAKLTDTVFDLTTGMKVKESYRRIGSLDNAGDKKVQSIFHGARVTKYVNGIAVEVNQGITSSFDPATLTCISCKTEHKITDTRRSGQPATLIFTDQNFTSTWGEDGDNCIGIFRVENCSLTELTDMIMEVLDSSTLKPGLHRHGTSIYAGDWVSCTTRIEQRWSGVQVCR